MSLAASPAPWIAVTALGFFHGINPAMGWLFAVALGLQQQSRNSVLLSWVPIALGHAAGVGAALGAMLAVGLVIDHDLLRRIAAMTLIGWALWHALCGHRQRPRVGMQAGLLGLAFWSFLMSSAHGAGLMLVPVLLPLCAAGSASGMLSAGHSAPVLAAALALHTAAMLAAVAMASVVVYEWIGLAALRSAWINFDLIWISALLLCGGLLLIG